MAAASRLDRHQMKVILLMRRPLPNQMSIERVFQAVLPHLPEGINWEIVQVPSSAGAFGRIMNLAFTARLRADVVHIGGDIQYCALAVRKPKCVLTVLDLGSLHRLKGARRWLLRLLWYRLPIRTADVVTAISETVLDELRHECPQLGEKGEVVYCAASSDFSPWADGRVRTSTFRLLQVGTAPNKNLERVLEALKDFSFPLELRVVGSLSPTQLRRVRELNLGSSVLELGRLSQADLLSEYQNCDALIFASTYEGFGMPILEAQRCGLPVITSDRSAMPEVAGPGALLVDPEDIREIRTAIQRVSQDPKLRLSLAEAGYRNASRFESSSAARCYASIYRTVLPPTKSISSKKSTPSNTTRWRATLASRYK